MVIKAMSKSSTTACGWDVEGAVLIIYGACADGYKAKIKVTDIPIFVDVCAPIDKV